jgi:hypothetical protein
VEKFGGQRGRKEGVGGWIKKDPRRSGRRLLVRGRRPRLDQRSPTSSRSTVARSATVGRPTVWRPAVARKAIVAHGGRQPMVACWPRAAAYIDRARHIKKKFFGTYFFNFF